MSLSVVVALVVVVVALVVVFGKAAADTAHAVDLLSQPTFDNPRCFIENLFSIGLLPIFDKCPLFLLNLIGSAYQGDFLWKLLLLAFQGRSEDELRRYTVLHCSL